MNRKHQIILLSVFIMLGVQLQVQASTGNLKRVCNNFVLKLYSDVELIGIIGGNMADYSVTGVLVDNSDQVVYIFECAFTTSHQSKPYAFTVNTLDSGKEDPFTFAQKVFENYRIEWQETNKNRNID